MLDFVSNLPALDYCSLYCRYLLNCENGLYKSVNKDGKMLQIRYDQTHKSNKIQAVSTAEALSTALSLNRDTNANLRLEAAAVVANSFGLNNSNFESTNLTMERCNSAYKTKQIANVLNSGSSSNETKKLMLKKTNNDRKYPCGYPGCQWIFTRTNHVVRHQKRVHPDYTPQHPVTSRTRINTNTNNNIINNNNINSNNIKSSNISNNNNSNSTNNNNSTSNNNNNISNNNNGNSSNLNSNSNLSDLLKKTSVTSSVPLNNSNKSINSNFNNVLENNVTANDKFTKKSCINSPLNSSLNVATNPKNSLSKESNPNFMCNGNNFLNSNNLIKQPTFKVASSSNISQPFLRQSTYLKLNNIRRFECNVDNCAEKFSSEMLFNNHLKIFHGVDRSLINKSINFNKLSNNVQCNNLINSYENNQINLISSNNINSKFKNNINPINSQIKFFLSNKSIATNNQDSFTSYLNNLNTNLKLKLLQSAKANNSSNFFNSNSSQINHLTKNVQASCLPDPIPVHSPNNGLSTQSKLLLPSSNLNTPTGQNNKQHILITQIELPQKDPIKINAFECEKRECKKVFESEEKLIDHLYDEHRVLEPEVIVNLESTENWLLLEDPKKENNDEDIGLQFPRVSSNFKEDYRPSKLARSSDEPSLANTLGIVKEVITKIDNVNTLNNIATTSFTTYSRIVKNHFCNINNCTKSFSKRYHLVRHKLEAHQVGRLSLMDEILAQKRDQQIKTDSLSIDNTNTKIIKKPAFNSNLKQNVGNNRKKNGLMMCVNSFYLRRPPQEYRPFPCKYPECNWSFKRQYHLKRHIKTHQHYFEEHCEENKINDLKNDSIKNQTDVNLKSNNEDKNQVSNLNFEIKNNKCLKNNLEDKKENNLIKTEDKNDFDESKLFFSKEGQNETKDDKAVLRNDLIKNELNTKNLDKQLLPDSDSKCNQSENNLVQSKNSDNDGVFKKKRQYQMQLKKNTKTQVKTHLRTKKLKTEDENLNEEKTENTQDNKFGKKTNLQINNCNLENEEISSVQKANTDQANNSQDSDSEERYFIVETKRTRRKNNDLNNNDIILDLDNKYLDNKQQLLLLCNQKDMIILNSPESKLKNKERNIYVCDVNNCGKRFGRNCELTRHKLNHMDFWPYICEYSNCRKKFKRKDVYKNHQRTHEKNGDKLLSVSN